MDINEWLATEVMGWIAHGYWGYVQHAGALKPYDGDWNPTENIEQAFMCLDTFKESGKGIALLWDGERWLCQIGILGPKIGKHESKSKREEIALACAKATGYPHSEVEDELLQRTL